MHASSHHDFDPGFRFLRFPAGLVGAGESAVVYLHGAGERGDDLALITRFGLPAMLYEGRAATNCAVFCPQLEEGQVWQPSRVARFVESVRKTCHSVSLLGFSLGASGVCSLIAERGSVGEFAMAIAGQRMAKFSELCRLTVNSLVLPQQYSGGG